MQFLGVIALVVVMFIAVFFSGANRDMAEQLYYDADYEEIDEGSEEKAEVLNTAPPEEVPEVPAAKVPSPEAPPSHASMIADPEAPPPSDAMAKELYGDFGRAKDLL